MGQLDLADRIFIPTRGPLIDVHNQIRYLVRNVTFVQLGNLARHTCDSVLGLAGGHNATSCLGVGGGGSGVCVTTVC